MKRAHFSPKAREAVDTMFRRAASASFCLAQADGAVVKPVDDSTASNGDDPTLIVFTMATFTFKIIAIFHIPKQLGNSSHDAEQGITVLEALTEQGNLCCGAINRDLLPLYPCMGVSSPTVLQGIGSIFTAESGPRDVLRYALSFGESSRIHATLYLCPYADVDISMPATVAINSTGELEMF